jgi:hypothetical protein
VTGDWRCKRSIFLEEVDALFLKRMKINFALFQYDYFSTTTAFLAN